MELFLPALDTYVGFIEILIIVTSWLCKPAYITWYSPVSNFHFDLEQKRQGFVSLIPLYIFYCQGTQTQSDIHIHISVSLQC